MSATSETLRRFRDEIEAEIPSLEQELSAERLALQAAEAAHAEALAEHLALQEVARRGLRGEAGMSESLRSRVENARAPLTEAEKARGKARAFVASLERRIAERRGAVNQIDLGLTVAPFPGRPVLEVPKRTAPIVEYDNITQPAKEKRS